MAELQGEGMRVRVCVCACVCELRCAPTNLLEELIWSDCVNRVLLFSAAEVKQLQVQK